MKTIEYSRILELVMARKTELQKNLQKATTLKRLKGEKNPEIYFARMDEYDEFIEILKKEASKEEPKQDMTVLMRGLERETALRAALREASKKHVEGISDLSLFNPNDPNETPWPTEEPHLIED